METTTEHRVRALALVEPKDGHRPAFVGYLEAASRLAPDECGDLHSEWADREADHGLIALDPEEGLIVLTLYEGSVKSSHVLNAGSARLRAYELLALADLADAAHPPAPLDRFARLKRDILAVAEVVEPSSVRLGRILEIVRDADETGA